MWIATKAGLNDQFLPSLSMEPGVSAQSLQVLVKQADLDKGRRNDGLTSEELRQPRRKVRCPLWQNGGRRPSPYDRPAVVPRLSCWAGLTMSG